MDKFKFIFLLLIGTAIVSGLWFLNCNKKTVEHGDTERNIIEAPLPPPPEIIYSVSSHKKKLLNELFKECNLSGDKKQLVQACNYTNSTVRNYATNIAGKNSGKFNLGQVCDIFDNLYQNWKYVNDPKTLNYVEYASTSIQNNFNGDCDDFAVLICSAILSIGGEARINYAHNSISGHAFTEVNLGVTNMNEVQNYLKKRYEISNNIFSRQDKDNKSWLNLDWFANYPGGKYFEYSSGATFYIIQNYCEDF
jgi:hypothetical protein